MIDCILIDIYSTETTANRVRSQGVLAPEEQMLAAHVIHCNAVLCQSLDGWYKLA